MSGFQSLHRYPFIIICWATAVKLVDAAVRNKINTNNAVFWRLRRIKFFSLAVEKFTFFFRYILDFPLKTANFCFN